MMRDKYYENAHNFSGFTWRWNFDYVFLENPPISKSKGYKDDEECSEVSADEAMGRERPRSSERRGYVDSADMSIREVYPESSNDIFDSEHHLLSGGGMVFIADPYSDAFFKQKSIGKFLYEGMYQDCLISNFNLDDLADSSMGDTDLFIAWWESKELKIHD